MVGAIDIGGTKIAVGLVDHLGNVLVKQELPTNVDKGFDFAMDAVIRTMNDQLRSTDGQLHGIGIGCTGPIDPITGALGNINTLPSWEGGNPVTRLSRQYNVPIAMENDGDAVAIGETMCGAAKGIDSAVCITVGTGIGAGVMINGVIYRGVKGNHPELGHQIIDPSGPPCTCGLYGCWESLASGPAMALWMRSNAPPEYPRQDLTARDICLLAESGDELAMRAVQREARYLGIGIANIIACFLPEVILLGGGVMKSAHLFLPEIRNAIVSGCQIVPSQLCKLSTVSLGEDAGLIGAAQVWYHRYRRSRTSSDA